MASFKSSVFNFILRNRHLLQGKLKQQAFDFNSSIAEFRNQCEKGAARFAKIPQGVSVKAQIISNIKTEWLIPEGSNPEKMIFYIHGGGYVSGSCSDHRGFVSKFAKQTGFRCLTYEYRLAPEHPYPAAIDDSIAVYRSLMAEGYLPENILFAGESAGGGLCLALLLAIKEKALPMPCAAVAISPWTDLSCSGASYKTKNKVSLAPLNSWTVFSRYYAGNYPVDTPFISPLYGELKGLPPLFINSGTDDELYDDGEQFYLKAAQAGVDVSFRAGERQIHCYPLLAPMFPEATQAMTEIVSFIQKHL